MGLMHTVKKSKKILRSALVLVMAFLIATTTLTQAYASYFPIVVQHVFLDDAEKAKEEEAANQGGGEDTDAPEEPDAGEEDPDAPEEPDAGGENPDAQETPSLAEELKNLTTTHEVEMKGLDSNRFTPTGTNSSLSDEDREAAEAAGNFEVTDEYQKQIGDYTYDFKDVSVKTDINVANSDKEGGIGQGEAAAEAAIGKLLGEEEFAEQAATLMSELQAAMSGGSLADKYDVERKMLALCAEQGLDTPTDEVLNQYLSEKGISTFDPLNPKHQALAAEYKLNFITGFTAKFRQACEAMVKAAPEAATLELVELDSQDSSAAVQTVEDSLAANPAVSSEQAAAAAEVVADMLEVLDSWSFTSTGGTVKGTDGYLNYGYRESTNYLGNAELTDDSKQVLLDNGYKSSSLEIQVVVQLWKDKLDENGNPVKKTDSYGREYVEQEAYSKVYVSLDGENWTDADDPDGEQVDADTVFASGEVELCTYTFTHSHRAKAPLRPRPGVEPEDPKDPPTDPKDPPTDPKDPPADPKDPVIPEEDVPLAELPEEEVPLAEEPEEEPEEVEIPEEDVPLSEIPKTGDSSFLWMCAAALSGAALLVLTRRKDEAEEV